MVRHYDPCIQAISFAIEEAYRLGSDVCDVRLFQPAGAVAGVKKALQLTTEVALDLLDAFGSFEAYLLGVLPGRKSLQAVCPLSFELKQYLSRQRIREAEGDKV